MKTSAGATAAVLTFAAAASIAGISGGGSPVAANTPVAPQLLLLGPVEAIDANAKVAVVLGQRVHVSNVETLAVGDAAAVFGTLRSDGTVVASAVESRGAYVPGASTVLISGLVQKAEPSVGRVLINGVAVDLTPAMSHGTLAPAAGEKLQVAGIQPVARGIVVVNGISGGGSGGTNGISGGGSGGTNGISGGGSGGTNGISGGGSGGTSGISGGGSGGTNGISGGGSGGTNGISGGGSGGTSGISGGGSGGTNGISGGGSGGTNGISGGGSGGTSGISGGGSGGTSGISGGGSGGTNGISGGGSGGTSGISGGGGRVAAHGPLATRINSAINALRAAISSGAERTIWGSKALNLGGIGRLNAASAAGARNQGISGGGSGGTNGISGGGSGGGTAGISGGGVRVASGISGGGSRAL